MTSFFERNADNLTEDAGQREGAGQLHGQYDGRKRLNSYAEIALDRIEADPQHREHFDEEGLGNLAKSLKTHGQQQPIKVRWVEHREKYIIIAGERRFRAAEIAGFPSVQCSIADENMTEDDILIAQIIENALREDLRATERAKAYRDLMDRKSWKANELAEEIHVNKSTVSRTLAILGLPEDLQQQIDDGKISIKDALKKHKSGEGDTTTTAAAKKSKSKRTREVRISVDGFTITVKARRVLTDQLVAEGLQKAIDKIASEPVAKAA